MDTDPDPQRILILCWCRKGISSQRRNPPNPASAPASDRTGQPSRMPPRSSCPDCEPRPATPLFYQPQHPISNQLGQSGNTHNLCQASSYLLTSAPRSSPLDGTVWPYYGGGLSTGQPPTSALPSSIPSSPQTRKFLPRSTIHEGVVTPMPPHCSY